MCHKVYDGSLQKYVINVYLEHYIQSILITYRYAKLNYVQQQSRAVSY